MTQKDLEWFANHLSDIESDEEPFPESESDYELSESTDSEESVQTPKKKE